MSDEGESDFLSSCESSDDDLEVLNEPRFKNKDYLGKLASKNFKNKGSKYSSIGVKLMLLYKSRKYLF